MGIPPDARGGRGRVEPGLAQRGRAGAEYSREPSRAIVKEAQNPRMSKAQTGPLAPAVDQTIRVPGAGEVSALRVMPPRASALYVLAHGAGAGMRHAFMGAIAHRLAQRGIGTLRYQFPYTEKGGRRPDPEP